MERYDKYKPSGIEWIGEVPDTWHISKMKYIAQYLNGYAFKPADWTDVGLPIIRIQDLTGTNDNPNYFNGQIPKKYLIHNGDILISWAATLDSFVWNRGEAWLNQHIFKTIVNEEEVDKKYFVWLSKVAMNNMNNENKHGIMMEHVTSDIFDNYCVPIPSLIEQEAIAAYLDERCGDIDKVVATQEKRIELLKELKQSEITKAVTRGLNPDVAMKDSGVEWIGMVPEHWDIMPFKFRMDINNGMDYKHIQVEDGYPVMGSGGQFACASQFMYDGEVVLLGRKGTVDKPLYFNGKFWAVDTMFYAIPMNKTCCKYMFYQATTFPFTYYQTATALPSMTQTDLGNNHVCVPPIAEQEAIAAYLDERCAEIDKQIEAVTKQIDLLREYKQSLITEVVTGKRKVC